MSHSIASSVLRLPASTRQTICSQCRSLHRLNATAPRIPKPTPFVPDAATFLTLMGRQLSKHSASIPSWEALFSFSSEQFKEAGVEPARTRRYLLWCRERFRNGIFGVGGDFKNVDNGVGELRIVQVPSQDEKWKAQDPGTIIRDPGMRRVVVNMPSLAVAGQNAKKSIGTALAVPEVLDVETASNARVGGIRIVRANTIAGTGVEPVKGQLGVARLRVKEGLWEQKRGHKVDGGERRKAEVRAKRRAAERKAA